MTDMKEILHGKDKGYTASPLTHFLTMYSLRYTRVHTVPFAQAAANLYFPYRGN